MKRMLVLGALVLTGGAAIVVAAQQRPQAIDVAKVADNDYVPTSSTPGSPDSFSGGNVGVFLTTSGVVLVDTKLAAWGDTFLSRVRSIKRQAGDDDHQHPHTRRPYGQQRPLRDQRRVRRPRRTRGRTWRRWMRSRATRRSSCPSGRFRDWLTLGRGAEQIDLYYFGRGHTDGDAFVVFPSLRLVQTGDLFAWKDGPRIDRPNGGSGVQYPQTIAKALATLTGIDIVVPGHSPMMKLADLQEYQRYTTDLLKTVQDAKTAGNGASMKPPPRRSR